MMHVCCCPQAYDAEGARVKLVSGNSVSVPASALWRHLGYTHDLPWSLGLRVEVDSVLGDLEARQEVVMRRTASGNVYVPCAAAFRPLVGMQFAAWRFMQPDTLVYAVRTAGCSAAAAEGDEEEEGEEEEDGVAVEEEERGGGAPAPHHAPPLGQPGASGSGSMHTIQVSLGFGGVGGVGGFGGVGV